ncbi:oligopeptide:H+ symporter [Luteococcus sp. H138]|uniref:peptide MFS transporter n=1 Tax=unclassified Luteococcus TaxID=2639923 RepID=UPI00313BBD7A
MSPLEQRSMPVAETGRPPLAMPAAVGVEMWERFSFYGMQAIMAYYLYHQASEGGLGIDRAQATALMGAYGAAVYLCTLAGGWLADRLLGAERTLFTGALTLVAGHLALSLLPGGWGVATGLVLVAMGSGALKTAAITVLGHAYPGGDDARRDAGFQLFYLGINVGALFGPLLTGWLSARHGFGVGFGAAAALMVIGLLNYLALRRRYLAELGPRAADALQRPGNPLPIRSAVAPIGIVLTACALIALLVTTGRLALGNLATLLLVVILAAAVGLFVQMLGSPRVSTAERARVRAFIPLFIASSTFWSVLNQTYGVFAVYSDVRLDRHLGGFEMPAAWTQSFNPAYILLLSLPMALLWTRLGQRGPCSATKMCLGVVISGCGMLVLLPFAAQGAASTPVLALAAAVLVITLGELLVGPVGMSATTAHAPAAFRTRFSALYFLSMALGTSLAGVLSRWYNPQNAAAERRYFLACGLGAIAIGLATLQFSRARSRVEASKVLGAPPGRPESQPAELPA